MTMGRKTKQKMFESIYTISLILLAKFIYNLIGIIHFMNCSDSIIGY